MEELLRYLDEKRGRRGELAAALGISPSAISMWKQVPAERVGDVARATGIPPDVLRPDIFRDTAPAAEVPAGEEQAA